MKPLLMRIASVGLLVLASACGASSSSLDNIRAGIPDSSSASVNTPSSSNALIGQTADAYLLTWGATTTVNLDVLAVLGTMDLIVQLPPTSHPEPNVYVWGPGNGGSPLDPLMYKLTVTDNGNGTYSWNLDARDKNAPDVDSSYQTLISGSHTPVVNNGVNDPKHGNGTFLVDFDARKSLPVPPKTQNGDCQLQGTAQVTYDNRNDDAKVDVAFTNVVDENTANCSTINPTYHYAQPKGGDGLFQFGTQADLNGDGIAENATIESRWKQDGSGRADIQVTGGSVSAGASGTASQCWDSSFDSVYEVYSVPLANGGTYAPPQDPNSNPAACAFPDAQYYNG